jgi:gluconokinase
LNVIGLEVSTSAAKCALYSAREGVIDSIEIPFQRDVTDKITQDPEGMVAVALKALKSVAGRNQRDIAAIGLVGTWHSLLLLDKDRRPLRPISMWADLSATPTVAALKQDQKFVQDCYQRTGCMVHAMYPAYKFYHLVRTNPELAQEVCYLSSQVEYLFQVLTGGQAVSRCTASGTGLLNIHTLDWDERLLDLVGLRRDQLSDLEEVFHHRGLQESIAREVGLKAGTPVTVGGADGAMNQVAIGGARQGVMSFSVGTSGAMRMAVDAPKLPQEPSTWCYYLYDGQRLAGAATNGATNCIDWYLDRCGHRSRRYDDFDRAAAEVDVESAPIFLPFIYGERCPGWDENRPGGFVGLKSSHGPPEMYYAILEGVLFNLYQCYTILTEVADVPERILVSGGIMHSPFWLQLACDLLGRELWTTGTKNDSTMGAVLVALASINGRLDGERYVHPRIICSPSSPEKASQYRRRYEKYLEFYHATQGII